MKPSSRRAITRAILLGMVLGALITVGIFAVIELRSRHPDQASRASPSPTRTVSPSAPATSGIPPTEVPTSPALEGRDGLHFTAQEVAIWRQRAKEGPYKRSGDVSPNSPGDWDRIVEEAAVFMEDPRQALEEGPQVLNDRGCVKFVSGPRNNNNPRLRPASQLRDAAFEFLVTGDPGRRDAVKNILLEQATVPGFDFSDRERFCLGAMRDGSPGFDLANWLTKLVYAYDYLGPEAFDETERRLLNSWFYEAANFFARDIDLHLNRMFQDRWSGDLRLSSLGLSEDNPRPAYYGGPTTYPIHRFYNNRGAARMRFVAAAAVKLQGEGYTAPSGEEKYTVDELGTAAKMWVREWIIFSVFPDGSFGEFERWRDRNPDLGLAYAGDVLAPALTIADLFARAGDTELYEFATTDGALGTESEEPKSLLFAARSLGGHFDGSFERYGTADATRAGSAEFLIDGENRREGNRWASAHEVQVVIANIYYEDPYLRDVYMRNGPRRADYPANPTTAGQHIPWQGDWGTRPGILFMYGQMEQLASPYP